jgi:hypothetical protein
MHLGFYKMNHIKINNPHFKQIKEDFHEATLTNLGTEEFVSVCVKYEISFFNNQLGVTI